MKKISLLVLIILFLVFECSFSQLREFNKTERTDNFFSNQIFYSYWINPIQFEENFILNYNIRYDFLLFEKTPPDKPLADTFQARLKVILELSSTELLTPIRSIEEVTIKTAEFEQTISKTLFYQSNFSLKIPSKKYRATLTIFDAVRNKEFSLQPFEVDLSNNSNFEPIFIKESDLNKISNKELKNNFFNFLPFSSEKFVLLLPDNDEFRQINISNKFINYTLKRKEGTGLRFSIFDLDTLDLIESRYYIKWGENFSKSKEFQVKWIDKPEYLKNFDNALKILNYLFENGNDLNKYYVDKEELKWKFYNLWKKFDPTPSTPYNELMAEFYRRADYASLEFKSFSQPDGALTDRGKIYIIYGPPTKIDRTFSKDGRAIEIWTYNINREIKFTFFDENKNGNYILQK